MRYGTCPPQIMVALVCVFVFFAPAIQAFEPAAPRNTKVASLPELPQVLAEMPASRRGHGETGGAILTMRRNKLGIQLSTEAPLSASQWDAVTALRPSWLTFNDKSLSDADMDRLVAIDPEEVHLRIIPLTGVGAKRFGDMKRLTHLYSHHMTQPTPEARDALANHPSLEAFRTAGSFCIDALDAPRLRFVELAGHALTVENIRRLAARSTITTLVLFAHGQIRVDNDFIAEAAKIKSLESLQISKTVLSYQGGLEHLQDLPRLKKIDMYHVDTSVDDVEKLRKALPNVTLRHKPMAPEYRAEWDKLVAKQATKPSP